MTQGYQLDHSLSLRLWSLIMFSLNTVWVVEYTVSLFSLPTLRGLCTWSWIGTRLGLVNTVKMLFYLNSFLLVTKKPKVVKIDVW